ncbi:MAG: aminotransferase [Kofleriaceae bacterium]|jgi:N-succinyldiaminopimelate aminotransferase|nr:aminotransferase [Kofleriaceae bacterium]MBP6836468.1 aminotransferase [Kofleriaceae bacterium]MBP9207483.1 aminotransferase [Kofleriaceae bacterium]
MRPLDPTLAGSGTTIFETMSGLARAHQAVNLGQGFPDERGPLVLREAGARYLVEGHNQYPPMMGLPGLRQAVARHARRWYGLEVDWEQEVLVTSGATEALLDCFLALLAPGDEALVLEPAYDTYAPVIRRLGAVPVPVRLVPPTWDLPRAELAAAITPRTKLVVLNTPMNPCGRVLPEDDLAWLAAQIVAHDLYAVCDEVYEHLVFAGARHVPLMTLPGMRDRCARIGSAGKTFSLTGWKVGYVTAAPALLRPIAKAHQFTTFTTPPNLQHAVALGLDLDDAYFAGLAGTLERSRDRLADGLRGLGLPVLPAEGTYFLVADVAGWMRPGEDDQAFCRRLVVDAGVVVIPMSAFYLGAAPASLVRFCFCKEDATIDAALERLRRWRG